MLERPLVPVDIGEERGPLMLLLALELAAEVGAEVMVALLVLIA
jgi:hypothetical protein